MTRALEVRLYDTTIGIWQDDAQDPTFREDIYTALIRFLRSGRWDVRADPRVLKHYRCISKDRRLGSRGDLRLELSVNGRNVELSFWAETWPIDNPNGRRYDFGKRARLNYLDRVRVDLETREVIAWLRGRAEVAVSKAWKSRGVAPGQLTAMAFIEASYAESWHNDKALGRPVCSQACNSKSGDGGVVEHGATVWFTDRKGRICRGVAFYHINNMWWIVTDRYGLENKGSHEIYVRPPANLRVKRNERARRKRLESELAKAIRASDFRRAERVKHILFGPAPTYGIWSRKWEKYYAPSYSGYSSDGLSAGRYTWDEAVREVRRVPHILSLVLPDGRHVEADELDRREAA